MSAIRSRLAVDEEPATVTIGLGSRWLDPRSLPVTERGAVSWLSRRT
jgi:hypothetical protein